ncbi:hypothetical protein J2755_001190 [Methanohalophilus levihalophilus]|nr:hypothetical protein [Methanohalophilus levihalophilus]MBP2030256.1 hypothetical protein [Methanohalophilus levihalophilus]
MEVVLTVDGKDIELNDFVQKILGNLVSASAESLHGVEEDWARMEVSLKK